MAIYIPDIPQGNQQINNTTNSIQQNFQYIYDIMAINHVPFNTANDFGKHNFVSYLTQTSDPATGSEEIALYSKLVANDLNIAELFYRYPNNGTVVQLTGNGSGGGGGGSTKTGGYFQVSSTSQLGYPSVGYWQYMSNGVLLMSWSMSNYVDKTYTSPYQIIFPCGYTDTITGTQLPSFTQNPFVLQLTGWSAQYGTSINYAAVITSKTTANIYYNGSFNKGSSIPSIVCTAIGI